MSPAMMRTILNRLALLAILLVVGLVSVQSAARMAPDATIDPAMDAWLASGASLDALCGLPGKAHQHDHCPFCHKLGATPDVRLARRVLRLALVPGWQPIPVDLTHGQQHGNPNLFARAPPLAV